jgi:hypothetical protein
MAEAGRIWARAIPTAAGSSIAKRLDDGDASSPAGSHRPLSGARLGAMKQLMTSVITTLAIAVAQTAAAADTVSKDIPARIEAIPIQTLTLSDQQFLKGDAYDRGYLAGCAGLRAASASGPSPWIRRHQRRRRLL